MPVQLNWDHLDHPVWLDSTVKDDIGNAGATSSYHGENVIILHIKGCCRIPRDLQHTASDHQWLQVSFGQMTYGFTSDTKSRVHQHDSYHARLSG